MKVSQINVINEALGEPEILDTDEYLFVQELADKSASYELDEDEELMLDAIANTLDEELRGNSGLPDELAQDDEATDPVVD